jgi:hypothetical protein
MYQYITRTIISIAKIKNFSDSCRKKITFPPLPASSLPVLPMMPF